MTDIIVLIACTLCGFAVGKYVEKRVKRKGEFYNDLTRYVMLLKVNVEGRKVELADFNREFTSQCSSVFADFIDGGKIACSLSGVQKDTVTKFFGNLSCSSSEELSKHIEYYNTVLAADSKQVTDEVAKASVYVKLGILFGLMVGIVLM